MNNDGGINNSSYLQNMGLPHEEEGQDEEFNDLIDVTLRFIHHESHE